MVALRPGRLLFPKGSAMNPMLALMWLGLGVAAAGLLVTTLWFLREREVHTIEEFSARIRGIENPVVDVLFDSTPTILNVGYARLLSVYPASLTVRPFARLQCRTGLWMTIVLAGSFAESGPEGTDETKVENSALRQLEGWLHGLRSSLPEGTTFLVNGERPDWFVLNSKARALGIKRPTEPDLDWRDVSECARTA